MHTMTPAMRHIAALQDAQILDLIACIDRLDRPLDRRFEGDDAALVALMRDLHLTQHLVDKLLVGTLVLREAVHRGLTLTRTPN